MTVIPWFSRVSPRDGLERWEVAGLRPHGETEKGRLCLLFRESQKNSLSTEPPEGKVTIDLRHTSSRLPHVLRTLPMGNEMLPKPANVPTGTLPAQVTGTVPQNQSIFMPEDSIWKRYSSHQEFPLSVAASVVL